MSNLIRSFVKVLMVLGVVASATSAAAADRVYNVSGALTDGGAISGRFTYDATQNIYSAINITTTTGTARAGASYTRSVTASGLTQIILAANSGDATGGSGLYLRFDGSLTETTTAVNVSVNTVEGVCGQANCQSLSSTQRTATGGSVTFVSPPAVSGLSPSSGPTVGGTSVVITGTNFTSASAVTFGGTPATGVTVNSATQITATAPARAAGVVNVVVTTASGASANTVADDFTYVVPAPVPTLSEWAMILFGTILAGGAALYIQRRRFTA